MSIIEAERTLRSAIWDTLLADTGLCAALGGAKVYDWMPVEPDFPYVRVGDVTSDDHAHWIVLHAFSRGGREQAHIITGALLQALDGTPLKLEGYRLVNLRFAIADIHPEADGKTHHALVRFCATTEELK